MWFQCWAGVADGGSTLKRKGLTSRVWDVLSGIFCDSRPTNADLMLAHRLTVGQH